MKESNDDCVFCKILQGDLPVSLVYEDSVIAAFVDLYPVNEGHLLIIPKVHEPSMEDVETEILGRMMAVAQMLNSALRASDFRCEGVNLFLADGRAAHQEVFHCHLHVIPRFEGDGFGFSYDKSRNFVQSSRERMDEIAGEIRKRLTPIDRDQP